MKNQVRRTFLKKALGSGIAAAGILDVVNAAEPQLHQGVKIRIRDNDIILFQGDSITDGGRDHKMIENHNSRALGGGYAFLAAADLLRSHPERRMTFYNRGIGGNKVVQLAARWHKDCLDMTPNVLSILIGVNDYWAKFNGTFDGTLQLYRDDYRKLIEQTLRVLPDVKLVIGEPFAIKNVKAVTDAWYPAFDGYREAAREIAADYQAAFVPYQKVFDKAVATGNPSYWTTDGVHPTLAGAQLMAEAWRTVVR